MASRPCRDLIKKPLWPSHQTTSEPAGGTVPAISSSSCVRDKRVRSWEFPRQNALSLGDQETSNLATPTAFAATLSP